MNYRLACFLGANPFIGRIACLLGWHVCKDSSKLFQNSNPDYFRCCVCGRDIEVHQKEQG
jgi:hypothetical protein